MQGVVFPVSPEREFAAILLTHKTNVSAKPTKTFWRRS